MYAHRPAPKLSESITQKITVKQMTSEDAEVNHGGAGHKEKGTI